MELAVIRTCRAHGLSLSEFHALPEGEKVDLVAYDFRRQQQLHRFYSTVRESKYPDAPSLMLVLLAMME